MKDTETARPKTDFSLFSSIDFPETLRRSAQIVEKINLAFEDLVAILTEYESYEVACDEISRTIDLLGVVAQL